MTEVLDKPSTALTLPQRAIKALGESANMAKLRELASQSAGIVAVIDPDGREQAHRAAMVLRTTRTSIVATGKAAREDAVAFGKAVIALEKELIAVIEPEEDRLISLRDKWDEVEQARKDALILAERQRVEAIQARIQTLAHLPVKYAGATAAELAEVISEYDGWQPDAAFEELADRAKNAVELSLMALRDLLTARQQQEQKAAEAEAARLAEIERVAAERKQLAEMQAETARVAAELAEGRKRLAEQEAAQQAAAKAQQDAIDAQAKSERDAAARAAAQAQADLDEQRAQLEEERRAMAAQQAAHEARVAADHKAQADAAKREADHPVALEMNAAFDAARAEEAARPAPAADVAQLVDLADAAGPLMDIEPLSDEEIIRTVAEVFDLDRKAAIERLAAIDFAAAREA
jgi:myosin heavy subunit